MKACPERSRRVEWAGIFGCEVIQPVSVWLVKAERVGVGPSQDGRAQFLPGCDGLCPDE